MARKPRAGVLALSSPALGRHRANHSEAKKVEKLIPTPGMSCSWHSMTPSGSLMRQTVENGKVILKMQSNSELDFRPAKAHTRTQTQHTHTQAHLHARAVDGQGGWC